tara:strand:+ start:311 stop:559 length:249 start_codon:yes stop_codon:yes gene_type:complete
MKLQWVILYNSLQLNGKGDNVDIDNFLSEEPDGSNPAMSPLWWQAKGDRDKAHNMVQSGDENNNWVHAHLHRIEGDLSNAAY